MSTSGRNNCKHYCLTAWTKTKAKQSKAKNKRTQQAKRTGFSIFIPNNLTNKIEVRNLSNFCHILYVV